jgi:hypothetical protein
MLASPCPRSWESPAVGVCHWILGCRFAVAAAGDTRVPLATLLRSISSETNPRVDCRHQGFSCRRSLLLGVQPVTCRLPSAPADAARLFPCSICLVAPPSRYVPGVGGPHFDRCPIKSFPCPVLVQGCTSLRRHLLTFIGRFAKFFRDGRPGGSLPAFASGYVAARIQTVTAWPLLSPPSSTRTTIGSLCSETTLSGAGRAYRVPHV